ncbi:hypothetical protein D3C77_379580 [compost metagenome]
MNEPQKDAAFYAIARTHLLLPCSKQNRKAHDRIGAAFISEHYARPQLYQLKAIIRCGFPAPGHISEKVTSFRLGAFIKCICQGCSVYSNGRALNNYFGLGIQELYPFGGQIRR